jgi:hypothetical protein
MADISQEWQQSVSLKAEIVLQVSVTAIQPVLPCELRRWIVLLVNPRRQCYRRQNVRATRLHWAMLNMRGAGWLFPSENLKMPIGADN